jgi:hypothetical protein
MQMPSSNNAGIMALLTDAGWFAAFLTPQPKA